MVDVFKNRGIPACIEITCLGLAKPPGISSRAVAREPEPGWFCEPQLLSMGVQGPGSRGVATGILCDSVNAVYAGGRPVRAVD